MTPAIRLLLLCLMVTPPALAAKPPASPVKEYSFSAPPAWVVPQSYENPAAAAEQQSVESLLVDDQILLGQPHQEYRRRVFKPLTTVGVEDISELKLHFNPAFQNLEIHQILIRRGVDVRDITRSAKLRVVHREEQLGEGIQDGEATVIAILDDIRTGDIIDYSYSVNGSNPIFGQKQFGFVALDGGYHIDRLNIRLVGPRTLQVRAFNNSTLKIDTRDLGADRREYRVLRENVPSVPYEDNTPIWFTPFSWLEYSEYKDWADVEGWARSLYAAEARKAGPLFDALYARLAKAATSQEDFITRALFAVQNDIRYLGLEFGENSHRPRPPEEVLKKRYGDCKDKALLLSKLLQKHGLQAWPALVSTRFGKGIGGQLPGPGLFDHVITLLDYQGKHYWLDGTRRYQAGSLDDLGRHDLGLAMVIGDEDDGLTVMYDTPVIRPTIGVEEHYYANDYSGPVQLESVTTFMGNAAEAQREYFNNRPMKEIRKSYADYASQYHDDLSVLKPLEFEDDQQHNRFIVREFYRLDSFWKASEDMAGKTLQAPFVLDVFADLLRMPNTLERKTPVQLPSPRVVNSRIYLHLPSELNLKFDNKPLVIEEKAFRFTNIDRYFDRTFYNHSELLIREPAISAADFPAFRKTIKEMRKQWEFNIYFPTPEKNGYPEIQALHKTARSWSAP